MTLGSPEIDMCSPSQDNIPCKKSRSDSEKKQWDINDTKLPIVESPEPFQMWPDGHCRYIYSTRCDEGRRHFSGWAMRNTNNHNVAILKKSCLGVLLCSTGCSLPNGKPLTVRPAICDKARKKQCGKSCPNPRCSGVLMLTACRGHCGYPVTHFWRQSGNFLYFQAKGTHDHPAPDLKKSSSIKKTFALAASPTLPSAKGVGKRSHGRKRKYKEREQTHMPMPKIPGGLLCSCPPFECLCGSQQPLPSSSSPVASHSDPPIMPFSKLSEDLTRRHQYQPNNPDYDPMSSFLPSSLFHQSQTPSTSYYDTLYNPSGYSIEPFLANNTSRHPSPILSHAPSNNSFSSPPPLPFYPRSANDSGSFQPLSSSKTNPDTPSSNDQYPLSTYLVNTLTSTFKSDGQEPIQPPPSISNGKFSNLFNDLASKHPPRSPKQMYRLVELKPASTSSIKTEPTKMDPSPEIKSNVSPTEWHPIQESVTSLTTRSAFQPYAFDNATSSISMTSYGHTSSPAQSFLFPHHSGYSTGEFASSSLYRPLPFHTEVTYPRYTGLTGTGFEHASLPPIMFS